MEEGVGCGVSGRPSAELCGVRGSWQGVSTFSATKGISCNWDKSDVLWLFLSGFFFFFGPFWPPFIFAGRQLQQHTHTHTAMLASYLFGRVKFVLLAAASFERKRSLQTWMWTAALNILLM